VEKETEDFTLKVTRDIQQEMAEPPHQQSKSPPQQGEQLTRTVFFGGQILNVAGSQLGKSRKAVCEREKNRQ
jgi:hypothetical protein